jgi:hypothetical protein
VKAVQCPLADNALRIVARGADRQDKAVAACWPGDPHPEVAFPDSAKSALLQHPPWGIGAGAEEMSQISFAFLIVLGLALTGYFGLAAWRLSGDDHTEITGTVLPKHR